MQFFESSRFVFLWLLVIGALIWKWGSRERQRRLGLWGGPNFLERRLMPGFSPVRARWGWAFLLAVFFFSTLALARPQWGDEKKKVERKGVDLVFLLDTSLSMLAEDVKPNRLAKSKLEIKNMIRRLKGDRVGMVGFSGSSFLQCPLTLDYSAFLLFVDALKPGFLPTPGTSLAEAIQMGIRAFPEESRKYRAVIIFSDGEDHEGGIEQALAEAKKAGLRIYVVGTGTAEGDPIPLRSGTDPKVTTGYKKDRNGQVVITRLNEPLLAKIAKETGGLYFQATAGEREIDRLLKHLETLGERQLREKMITEREDHFQFFLFLAFLFLMAELWLKDPKKARATGKGFLLAASFLFLSGFLDSPHSLVQKGNELNKEKKYQSAVENYRKAQVTRPEDPVIRYNLGTNLYQLYRYRDAEKELEAALAQAKDPATKAQILYNHGNTKYRLGDFEKAIDSYKKALEINPKDEDAKYNLEFLQKKKSLFENKQKEQNQKQKKQQPQNQPQQQNQDEPNPQQQKDQEQQNQKQQQNQQQQQEQQQSEGGGQDPQQDQQARQGENQGGEKPKDEKDKGDQGQDQEQQGGKKRQEQDQEKPSEGQEGQEKEEQSSKPQEEQNQQEEQPSPQMGEKQEVPSTSQSTQGNSPLQGQMTKENALQILNILREGEKQMQDTRRPPGRPDSREVLKDW